jgi:hypothetical protein
MRSKLAWLSIALTLSTSAPALAQGHDATPVNRNTGIVPPVLRGDGGHREREERERRDREERERRERAERERREREERERRAREERERREREHRPDVHSASPVNR